MELERIESLGEIAKGYDAVFCDVWGVLHNGVACWQKAASALARFRSERGPVVMITNAPRPNGPVLEQLNHLKVPEDTFDEVITSGDVTRNLISQINGPVYHIGPERDHSLYEGLNVELSDIEHAGGVVCTGLNDDRTETPEEYADTLARLRERDLEFICANPDIVVEYGNRLLWCAGALARDYKAIGGKTRIVGKPHRPMYEAAMEAASRIAGKPFDKSRILAIGDGMPTDIKGAQDYGVDVLYISAGIHAEEYGDPDNPDHEGVVKFVQEQEKTPVAYMPRLAWD